MSSQDGHSGAKPKFTPTALEPANPFDSTHRGQIPHEVLDSEITREKQPSSQETQLSDPPTALVPREAFRELPPGSIVGDNYEIDAKIGAGAMGDVYAARHVKLGKRVAIKVIGKRLSEDASAIERFSQEARALAQIQHPAIVAVDHVGELADGRAYFVMEMLQGESLFNRLQRERLSLTKALRVFDQIARGLEAAHAHGVIHRDLKPENIFLARVPGEPSIVKLLDFGLSKLRGDVDYRAERTQSGVAIGTPMYMSPEQARGPDVDHRTDIYALGCVAYELVLGRSPFPHAKTAPELYAAHLHEAPPLPRSIWPEIPPQLDLVLFAMLTKDPAYRPTLAQVRSVIADVRTGTPSQRAATEFVGQRVMKTGRSWAPVVGLLTLVLGIMIGAVVTSRSARQSAKDAPVVDAQVPIAEPTTPTPAPAVQVEPITKENPTPPPRPRSHPATGSAMAHPPKATIVVPSAPPADAGTDAILIDTPEAAPPPKTKTTPWTDRNQTINPFTKKKTTP